MRIVTINLSPPHVKALEMLQQLGIYPSRSEAIRVAVRDFLLGGLCKPPSPAPPAAPVPSESKEETKKTIERLLRSLEAEAAQ